MRFDIEYGDSVQTIIDNLNSALEHIGYEVKTQDYDSGVTCEIYKTR